MSVLLKPALGADGLPLRVLFPDSQGRTLLQEGEQVEINNYWQRRINSGDVVLAKPEKKKVLEDNQ